MRDPRDFDSFYLGTAPRVTSQVYAMVGNRADAEDIVQEAYARAWQYWDKVSGYDSPEAWVRTIAFRIAVSTWRKAINRFTAHRRHGAPESLPGADPNYVAIVAALRLITPEQRRAVVLFHLVGLSVAEIAAETGVAVGTVRARLTRGRQALAPHLSEYAAELSAPEPEVAHHG
ncbi:RNA polymerase sigma factor [Actinocatenispora rupis]|uniref:RNA polymerase sigma24 factor n=1 Tax=Actinocatenispora rupis TaxID=519421 RepID=A0A8J3JB41_9ACTN|nr:SigE family RNA polymerase sigma factor [Actinocatenispora rupis]GID13317.1 RNA polymerase sigma24 factor [Actinocatenispora rupis]